MISFLAATYGNVEDIEILWTIIALIGAGFSIYNLREALIDLQVLRQADIQNGRTLLAKAAIKNEAARFAIQIIFITVGVLAMLLPAPPSQLDLPTIQIIAGAIARWGFVIAASLIALKSFWGYQVRETLRDYYVKDRRKPGIPIGEHTPITDVTPDSRPEETRVGS